MIMSRQWCTVLIFSVFLGCNSCKMIIRVQSHEGTKRIECAPNETVSSFISKVKDLFSLNHTKWKLYLQRNRTGEIRNSKKLLSSAKLKHGDMVYLVTNQILQNAADGAASIPSGAAKNASMDSTPSVPEDEIDVKMWQTDGRIRKSDNSKGMFKIEDLSVEPWDETYLREKEIKFMSFHAYMRKQTAGVDKGKYLKLENAKAACKLSNDEMKRSMVDLPSAVTLNRQKFRHVDNIMFENREIVDRYLNYWRITGNQRMAYLYGRYAPHSDVPLGIRAEVCAIFEPQQESTANSLNFYPDNFEQVAEHIAKKLGLCRVGWILTDLVAEQTNQGAVKNTRNPETYFLSAEECITAATFQNQNLNPCRLSSSGYYGSKFTTVVVSGDADSQIAFEGYQVSNQGMSLVADNCLVPTIDAPELGYVRESSTDIYVADVYYKEKDEYGNEITKPARPLPLEYLLVDVPTAFPRDSQYTCSNKIAEFPIFNRQQVGQVQSLEELAKYMNQFGPNQLVDALSDFHFLLFLATNDHIPMHDELDVLLDAVRNHDNELATHWSECPGWSTLLELMRHAGGAQDRQDHTMDADMREAIERSLQMQ